MSLSPIARRRGRVAARIVFAAAAASGLAARSDALEPTPIASGQDAAPAEARAADAPAQWHDPDALQRVIEDVVAAHPELARLVAYGKSREGRDLWSVELGAGDASSKERRPALLVVAGLDGQHLVGTELVLDHLRRLTSGYGSDAAITKLLDEHVVHLIPRANPIGAAAWFHPIGARREVRGNLRPVDDDRDGAIDEDPPVDLNQDGVITQMRWKDPAGTWIEDPAEPRWMRPADAAKGERGTWKVAVESLDRDGDGEHGEDGPGDVVPARNFPQRWTEHDPSAGRVPLDEPEALALTKFLFERPSIAIVVVYGLHDNLAVDAKSDQGNEQPQVFGEGGRGGGFRLFRSMPSGIVRDDQPLYAELAKRYRETTGVTSKPPLEQDDGAFWTFAYFQFGVPSLAMHVWSPPLDVKKPEAAAPGAAKPGEAKPEDGKSSDAKPEGEGEARKPADAPAEAKPGEPVAGEAKPAAQEPPSPPPPASTDVRDEGGGRRGGRGRGGGEPGAPAAKPADTDEPKLLVWNDVTMNGAAFVPWTEVAHPTLGEVEVGGWKPLARTNPPLELVPELATKHGDFLIQLGGLFAQLRIADVKVEPLGGGVHRVTATVVNEGYLPSVCSMGERSRRPRPTRLDLEPGGAKLLQGDRRHTWTRIEGSGGRREVKWLLQGDPGASFRLVLWSEKGGGDEREVKLP